MPRQARLDAPGTLHHVIIRGIERRAIVANEEDRRAFVERLGRLASELNTDIYAWALLTNHAHLLLRSGPRGLPAFMRRLLTGYAQAYNRRHRRHGHLFQNRYKSIVCEEEGYFTELVRYIHLNPFRAKLVRTLEELDTYPWSGHAIIMGQVTYAWQEREFVLSWFGKTAGRAKRAYRQYMEDGLQQGRRPELVGGGLVRSRGGWSEVIALRRQGQPEIADARILGGDDFVASLLQEAEERIRRQLTVRYNGPEISALIDRACQQAGVSAQELQGGSRRGQLPRVRADLAHQLVEDLGLPLAEVARQLGVTSSAIAKAVQNRPG